MNPPDCLPPRPRVVHEDAPDTMKGIGAYVIDGTWQPAPRSTFAHRT